MAATTPTAEYEPPRLTIPAVRLEDATGDGVIEGGEEFDLVVDISNTGSSLADGVQVQVRETGSNTSLPPMRAGRIDASGSHTVRVHSEGAADLDVGEMRIEVKAVDAYGVGPAARSGRTSRAK